MPRRPLSQGALADGQRRWPEPDHDEGPEESVTIGIIDTPEIRPIRLERTVRHWHRCCGMCLTEE
ncbi:MAG: hypothetical protein WAN20_08070 [Pseudonocardiaceae bacterium]|nr:hypothetical protein [Pseudonocardiaceae bacterium]